MLAENCGRDQALRAGKPKSPFRSHASNVLAVAIALNVIAACKPDLSGRPSDIDKDVVLAIQSSPAEVKPDEMPARVVTYEALYAGPHGAPDPSTLDWAFCDQPKPLALTGPIAPACLVRRARDYTVTISAGEDGGEPITETKHVLTPFGKGLVARSAIPEEGCRVFGPFPPAPQKNQPESRPADPDTTGGYYQPVRLLVPSTDHDEYSVGVTRLDCGISGATQEQNATYTKRHLANENPTVGSLVLRHDDGREETLTAELGSTGKTPVDGGASSDGAASPDAGDAAATPAPIDAGATPVPHVTVSPGESVTLRAEWAACPAPCTGDNCDDPKPCTGSEPYLNLDLIEHQLVERRESIRVSWFAADGTFAHDRTGRAESEADTPNTENVWAAPSAPTDAHLWVVIRDDRGGVGWSHYVIHVAP